MMTHFFPETFKRRRNGSSGERSNFGSKRPFLLEGKSDHTARVDQLAFIHHKNIVEVEKVQCADGLQLSYVRAGNARVLCDKRSKVSFSQEGNSFRSKPPIENNRRRLRYRKKAPPGTHSAME